MKKKFAFKLTTLLLFTILITFLLVKVFQNLNFGLDLKGGFEVLYKVESLTNEVVNKDLLLNTTKILSSRIDVLGVSEPEIIIEGKDKIRVKLAGIKDQDEAREILSKTASLTFRDTSDKLLMTSEVLKKASKETNPNNLKTVVALTIKDNEKFYEVTKKISQQEENLIVIWLDFEEGIDSFSNEKNCGSLSKSKCLSVARVSQAFSSNVVIEGNFTSEEAQSLAELIDSGSMPTKLKEISSRVVDASFGKNSLNQTLIAGIIGVILVIIIMISVYRFAGFISAIGIIIYTFLTFLIFYLINGVLTLPGIAALVLGIGMAVDSNVINFESLIEEINTKKNLKESFSLAYKKSFITILDANITTLIVAIILFVFGESTAKGFATMLIINIIVTMFVMFFVVKWILKMFINTKYFDDKYHLFINAKNKKTNFDFLKFKNKAIVLSIIILLTGIGFYFKYNLNLGIDYTGGSSITIHSEKKEEKEILKKLEDFDLTIIDVDKSENVIFLKVKEEMDNKLSKQIEEKLGLSIEVGVVSDIVKKDSIKNVVHSLLLSFIGILIYVAIRFSFHYSLTSIIALVHDVFIVIAIFAIFKLEINAIFVAAILTIIGSSINDTIVIFDKIRSNVLEIKPKHVDLYSVINKSLNQTFKRVIFTGLTTFVVVSSLIIFGAFEIINFNIALLIGAIFGTFSSIFIAGGLLYVIAKNKVNVVEEELKDEVEEMKIKGINS